MVDIHNMIRHGDNNWSEDYYDKWFICIHATVTHEESGGARKVGGWFNDPSFNASTQFTVDNREIVQNVPERAYAWSAGTTANKYGIHIELVAMPGQTRSQWSDPYSDAELRLAAKLTAELCAKHDIPIRKVEPTGLRAKRKGIVGHDDVRDAWHETSHWDPGPNFPWRRFIRMVREAANDNPKPTQQSPEDDDMALDEPLNQHDPKGNNVTANVTVREALSAFVHYLHGGRNEAKRYLEKAQDSKAPR